VGEDGILYPHYLRRGGRVFRMPHSIAPMLLQKTVSRCSVSVKVRCDGTRGWEEQGRNEVRWRPGQEANLAPLCSSLRSSRSKCTVLNKILVKLLGLFGAWGIVPPWLGPWRRETLFF